MYIEIKNQNQYHEDYTVKIQTHYWNNEIVIFSIFDRKTGIGSLHVVQDLC